MLNRTCTIDSCGKPQVARRLCNTHYAYERRHGNLSAHQPFRDIQLENPMVRFMQMVNQNGPVPPENPELGNCWLWTGRVENSGYTQFRVGGKAGKDVSSHRWIYEQSVGAIPEGLEIDHLCFVPICVNPTHLEAVTHAENIRRSLHHRQTTPVIVPRELRALASLE